VFTHVGSNYDLTQQIQNQNRWYWRVELPYDDTFAFDSMDNTDDSASAKLNGQLTFDKNGLIIQNELSGNTGPIMFDPSPIGANGASTHAADAVSITTDFDGKGTPIDGVTQYASNFTTRAYEQNGWEMGILETFNIDASGVFEGTYSNNVVKPLAQLALAMFPNEEGLVKLGDNTFGLSANTGLPNIVPANVAGAGEFSGGSLEQSNVDIVEEFTSMIVTERGFQANSRMVTTSDEMLTEIINLKR
jgi:flagellar hook protein FlgE